MNINFFNWRHYKGGADIFTYLLANEIASNYKVGKLAFNDENVAEYDIIHNNNCYMPVQSDILTIHGMDIDPCREFEQATNNASVITAITKTQKDEIEEKYKINIDKVIYNFSDMIYYPKKIGIPTNKTIIGYIGRLCKNKGIPSIYTLSNRYKNKIGWLLVGLNQEKYQETPNIKIMNHIQSRKVYAEVIDLMDVVIHPSYEDNQPISIIDALFRKKPIIARELPALTESFRDNLYFYSCNYELEKYISEIDEIKYDSRKIEKAFRYALEKFNPIDQVHKYIKMYKYIQL